jgi:hypothetical protein
MQQLMQRQQQQQHGLLPRSSATSRSPLLAAAPSLGQPRRRRSARAANAANAEKTSSSIRDFIAQEAPLRAIDGSYRERPLEPTLEAPYLIAGALPPPPPQEEEGGGSKRNKAPPPSLAFLPPIPGAVSLHALDKDRLAAVLASGGQVLLVVVEEGRPECVAVPSASAGVQRRGSGGGSGGGGAFAVAGRVAGVLGGRARVVAERRVAVQGVEAPLEGGGGVGMARAAELGDRWCYMCRASAVEEALTMASAASSERRPPPSLPREVALAVEQARDAARDVASELRACRALAAAMAEDETDDDDKASAAAEAEAELAALLDWCFSGEEEQDEDDEDAEAARLSWPRLVRLSYAPFAASALALLVARVSGSRENAEAELAALRLRAMATTDAGARLEDAAELASKARRRLAAVRALR